MDRKENPFDQFDQEPANQFDQFEVTQSANPFDQFDQLGKVAAPVARDPIKGPAQRTVVPTSAAPVAPVTAEDYLEPATSAPPPLSEAVRSQLDRKYDALSPQDRDAIIRGRTKDGRQTLEGMYFAYRDKQFAARDADTAAFAKQLGPMAYRLSDLTDPRKESRARMAREQGASDKTAENIAAQAAIEGLPAEEVVPQAKESKFDFDLAARYKGLNPVVRGAVKGYYGYKQSVLGLNQALGDLVGATDFADTQKAGAELAGGRVEAIGERPDYLSRNFEGAVSSVVQNIPGILGGIVTGGALVPLSVLGVQSFGQNYTEGVSRGLTRDLAAQRAGVFAAAEILGERFGLAGLTNGIRKAFGKKSFEEASDAVSRYIVSQIPGEQLTTASQFLADKYPSFGLNPQAGIKEYLQQAGDTLTQTIMQGGLMMGGVKGAQFLAAGRPMPEEQPPIAGRPPEEPPIQPAAERVEPTFGAEPTITPERVEPTFGAEPTVEPAVEPEEPRVPGMVTAEMLAPEEAAIAEAQGAPTTLPDVVRNWDRANRSGRQTEWQVGAAESNPAFEELGAAGYDTPAHGMAKAATLGEAYQNLINMLSGGIDQTRTLFTAGLTAPTGTGAGSGTAGGYAYRDGPFIITFRQGLVGSPTSSDVTGVLVNPANSELVPLLQQQFPNLVVRTYNEAADVVAASRQSPEGRVAPDEPATPPAAKAAVTPVQEPSNETAAVGMAVQEVPLGDLTLSKDVPQFKMGADAKGVVEPLGGKFERTGVAPIQVWRRLDGSLEVISGRHRLDLARRSGEKTIPAQVHDESQGFTPTMAAILDAELNIRDGQGKVKDYVNYFKAAGISPEDAESRGLLARSTGKRAYTIATTGSDELVAAVRNDQVGDEAAYYIALNAPNDPRLQSVGMQAVMDGKSANLAVNTMNALKALGVEQDTTTDMFGFDDSAMKEAAAMAQVANRKQKEIQTRLAAITGAAKRPELAKAEGIDVRDPEAVNRRIGELRQMKNAWDNWATNPELIGEIRQARGVEAPSLTLRGETEEEIRAREEAAAAEEQRRRSEEEAARRAERAEVERKRAEETTDLFQLGQTAEQQMSGMGDLFAAPAEPEVKPEAADTEQLSRLIGELQKARSEQEFTDAAVALGESVPKQPFLGVQLKEPSSGVRFNIARSSDGNRIVFDAGYDDPDGFEIARKPNQAWKLTKTPRFATQIIERNQAAPMVAKPEAKPAPQKPAAKKEAKANEYFVENLGETLPFPDIIEWYRRAYRNMEQARDAYRKGEINDEQFLDQKNEFDEIKAEVEKIEAKEYGKPKADTPEAAEAKDLFGQPTEEALKAQARELMQNKVRIYASGMSSIGDLSRAGRAAGALKLKGVGVDVGELSANAINMLAHTAVAFDGALFVDSGAFGAFRRGLKSGTITPINFDNVLKKYDAIIDAIGQQTEEAGGDWSDVVNKPMFVMPDVVGDQTASLQELKKHLRWVKTELRLNHLQLIVPLQRGSLSLSDAYKAIVDMLGTDNFVVGIPSNAAAITPQELEAFLSESKPKAIHILGAGSEKNLLPRLISAINAGVADTTTITADASPIRSAVLNAVASGMKRGDAIEKFVFDERDPSLRRDLERAAQGVTPAEKPKAAPQPKAEKPAAKPAAERGVDQEFVQKVRNHWMSVVHPALVDYGIAYRQFGEQRLENARIKEPGIGPDEWLNQLWHQQSKFEKGRKVQETGIQYLSQKDLWPTTDGSGERLRKAMLNAIKALKNAPGTNGEWIKRSINGESDIFGEAAKPAVKEEKPPYTPEQREEAEIHAKEVGGDVAWQRGDYALIRGYSMLSGDPVYAPAMGSSRARVDIASFTGKQVPDDVKQEMLEAKERLEKEAAEAHASNPFIKFKDGVALSEDIPEDLAGVIRGWKNLLKLDVPIYVSTLEDAKRNRSKFTGPHRRIGSGTLDENERGSMRRMADDSYYILFERSTSPSLMLETIAHEMGHVHQRLVYERASDADKQALQAAHQRWLESQKGKTAKELVEALRTRAVGRRVKGRPDMKAEDLTSYWKSFSEWYADQTARWAVSGAVPVSVVEKFFKRLGNQLRRFYQSLRGQKYLPNETFKEFIERVISPTYMGPTDQTLPPSDQAEQQLRDIETEKGLPETINVNGVDRSTRNSEGRPIHPTEQGIRNFWRWFGDSVVVDGEGRPLMMYHGTNKDIFEFRVNPRLPAIFLTPDPAFANMYAADDMAYFEGKPISREGANVISVYAQAKNPFDFNNQKHIAAVVRQLEDSRDRKRFRQGASKGRWQDIEDFMGFIEQAGFDSMYLMERGRKNLAVFSPTQIKSAVGNLGAFAPTEPSIIADIEVAKPTKRMSDEDIREEQIREYSALRQRLAAVPRRIAAGKSALPDGPAKGMTELERVYLKALVDRAQDLKAAIKISAPRLDSPEQFLARALKEYDAGNISKEVLDVIQAAYKQQPGLLNGLKLSIKQVPEGAGRVAGAFLNMSRIVRLYKGSSGVDDPRTIRHELTHSMEQMMTPEQRGVIIDKWQDDLAKAIRKNKDAAHQKYFEALLKFLDKPTMENYKAAIAAMPSYDMYQFINPSEYWAVNAENLMASQLGGHWQRFKAAMKRMFEALKDLFGFDNKYAVQRVFKDIMTGSKERVTTEMLADRAGIAVSPAQNIEEDKALIEKYKRPKTPMLDKKPLATFLLDQFKNGKDLFRDFVENPKEAAADAGNSLIDKMLQAKMSTVWYGAGLESRDFAKYGGQLRTSEGLATASVALDNAIRSGNIGVEVIFRGGLKFDNSKKQLVAVETKKGMRGVYDAERRLKDKLGNQLGTDIIQGYLEAKRSIDIMNEFYERQAAYEGAKDDLRVLREQGASEKKIDAAVAFMEDAERSLESVKKAVSSVTMTEEEMTEFAARDQAHPELREIMDNWTAVNQNLLRIWRDVGLLSPERYEALASIPDYVPWYRIMQDEEDPHTPLMSTTRGLTNIGREKLFKRTKPTDVLDFKGKEGKKVLDESGNLIGMSFKVPPSTVLRVEVDGEKIKAKDLSVTDDGRVMVKAPIDDASLVVFKVTRPIQNIVENMTQNVMRMTMNAIRQYAAGRIVSEYATRDPEGRIMTFPKEDLAKGRFSFVINGQRKVVEISDPLPLGAIYGMDSLNLKMFSLPAAFANFFRRTITLSGVFQLKQVFKDAPTAAAVTGVRNPAALILGTYKGLVTALLQPVGKKVGVDIEPVVDILKAAGIGGFQNPSRTPEAEVKRRLGIMNRNVFDFVIKALDHIGDSSDMAQRIAVYKRVMAETSNETQALYQAANVINFLHHGSSGTAQTLVKTVPFMGAYANAMDVLVNSLIGGGLKGMSRRKAIARLGVTTGMLIGITLLYTMLVSGDDDYEELDDQTKLRNFIIPGTDIMLPMNTSYAFFWKAMTEMLYNEAIKKATPNEIDRTRLKKALSTAARDMLLGPEPVPQIIKGPVEIAIGYNFFTGRDIIPEGLKNVETFQQYTAATSELGKWFSSYTEVPGTDGKRILSPIEADHLIRSTFGTAGALGQWVTNRIAVEAGTRPELTEKETPITGAFLRPEVDRGREDLFYDLRDRVNQKYNTLLELERDDEKRAEAYDEKYEDLLDLHKDINKDAADLSDINAEIRELSTSKDIKMTPAERRAEIRALQQEKKEILDDIYELRKEAGL